MRSVTNLVRTNTQESTPPNGTNLLTHPATTPMRQRAARHPVLPKHPPGVRQMTIRPRRCRGRRRATAPPRFRINKVTLSFLGMVLPAMLFSTPSQGDDLLLDWSEWEEAAIASSSKENASDSSNVEGSGKRLRRLVKECAARLEFPENLCEDWEEPDLQDVLDEPDLELGDYRVPLMESGDVACGFEKHMVEEEMESLASTYTFHFIGDSTTRRLGESFVSIFTGKGSTHTKAHSDLNFSSGNLKVFFYWAPHCSGAISVGERLKTLLDAMDTAKGDGRRAVIVTAFGVHDAFKLRRHDEGHGIASYENALPQDIVENEGMRAAAISACRDTTVQLIRTAAMLGTSTESDEGGVSLSISMDGASKLPALSPPLYFLLQNNRFPPDSVENMFLDDLHRVQRQEVEDWEESGGADRGLFLVNDTVSLYGSLPCNRIWNANSIHFREPVKLVEGKMLWDLLALVDR